MFLLYPIFVFFQDKVQEEESYKLKETYKTVPRPHLCFTVHQEICTLWFQFFGAVFASKGYPFKNIFKK